MKVETYQKLAGKAKRIRELVGKPVISAGKIEDMEAKIAAYKKRLDTHNEPVTVNISTTVIEVDALTAIQLLENSVKTEKDIAELNNWRMEKALEFLEGEYDVDFFNK